MKKEKSSAKIATVGDLIWELSRFDMDTPIAMHNPVEGDCANIKPMNKQDLFLDKQYSIPILVIM